MAAEEGLEVVACNVEEDVGSPHPQQDSACHPPAADDDDGGGQDDPLPPNYEYDFVDAPPSDYYCAVSMELLVDPQQTDCCGHHFTKEVAERLHKDKKPCPMCKSILSTRSDKFHRRRVMESHVRCLYKKNPASDDLASDGCEWIGQLGNLRDHVATCPKRPWTCAHCKYAGIKEEEEEHTEQCDQFPIACPKGCEVGTVPRCQLTLHHSVCLSEEVSCEYSPFGCTQKIQRRDLPRHMAEGEMQHLLKMCSTNLTLTRQLAEKLEEKDSEIARLQSQLVTMEVEVSKSVGRVRDSTNHQLNEVERKVASDVKTAVSKVESSLGKSMGTLQSSLLDIQRQIDSVPCRIPPIEFNIRNFDSLKSHQLEWRSPPFYTHQGGFKMCLGVSPYGILKGFGTHISLRLYKMLDSNSDGLPWDVRIRLRVHVLNQTMGTWEREYVHEGVRSKPEEACVGSSAEYNYIRHTELRHYVVNSLMRIRVTSLEICSDATSHKRS